MIGTLLGGIGLFLLGMILMTEGLKSAAGDALRRGLTRFTGGPGRAVLSGIGVTALVQSSSATVLTTIGFVSAGLLTFNQAVGVIFGANVGTTSTGWIVSLLGLKLSVSTFALPLVGLGALARFLLRGRGASVGLAVAGFGVIFVGIDVLQEGMAALTSVLDPARIPGDGLAGRLLLVGVGVLLTVVLQSSSAAVATTLTALHAGTVDLGQATMLVIGQNMGTTVTAALACLGASVPARRTGLAHILFNVITAVAAFALAPLFLRAAVAAGVRPGSGDPALALAAFHTTFNLLGIALLLPVAPRFAALVTRLVPDRGPRLTRHLDPSVARLPAVAVEAARRSGVAILVTGIDLALAALDRRRSGGVEPEREAVREALRETRRFLGGVKTSSDGAQTHGRHLAVLHALDHMERLADALDEHDGRGLAGLPGSPRLVADVRSTLSDPSAWLEGRSEPWQEALARLSAAVASYRRTERVAILERAASAPMDPDVMLGHLESLRWMDRVVYHIWRAAHHLAESRGDAPPDRPPPPSDPTPAEIGPDQAVRTDPEEP